MELKLNDDQQALLEEKINTAEQRSQDAQRHQQQAQQAMGEAQQARERALGLMEAFAAAEGLEVDVESLEYEDGVLREPTSKE